MENWNLKDRGEFIKVLFQVKTSRSNGKEHYYTFVLNLCTTTPIENFLEFIQKMCTSSFPVKPDINSQFQNLIFFQKHLKNCYIKLEKETLEFNFFNAEMFILMFG